MSDQTWGRVDAEGNVYVTEAGVERLVGAFPDATADEALAYFVRKFDDINTALVILERRLASSAAHSPKELRASLTHINELLAGGVGVGDFSALRSRAAAAAVAVDAAAEQAGAENAAAKERIITERTAIVETIEKLASSNLDSLNWKKTSAEVDSLFNQWQATQKDHVKVEKATADELWKRFRNARATLDRARRTHFSQADAETKKVKTAKEALIAQAEDLAGSPADQALPAYRALLEAWKKSGRASKKLDDALWAKFKAAGDAIYANKQAADSAEDESFAGNLEAKRALLAEGQAILSMTDREQARALLTSVQKRWESAGKVPRASIKDIEGGLRKLELAVKKLDDDAWSASDPEKLARQEGLAGAIAAKVAKLESDLETAKAAGDKKMIAEISTAIEQQRSWLTVIS